MTVTKIRNGQTIEKKQVIGTVEILDDEGVVTKTEEFVVDEVIVEKPMANVGVKLGHTRPLPELGQYNMLRVDVSLYMPSKTDKKSLNKTFNKCFNWCDDKLDSILDDL